MSPCPVLFLSLSQIHLPGTSCLAPNNQVERIVQNFEHSRGSLTNPWSFVSIIDLGSVVSTASDELPFFPTRIPRLRTPPQTCKLCSPVDHYTRQHLRKDFFSLTWTENWPLTDLIYVGAIFPSCWDSGEMPGFPSASRCFHSFFFLSDSFLRVLETCSTLYTIIIAMPIWRYEIMDMWYSLPVNRIMRVFFFSSYFFF